MNKQLAEVDVIGHRNCYACWKKTEWILFTKILPACLLIFKLTPTCLFPDLPHRSAGYFWRPSSSVYLSGHLGSTSGLPTSALHTWMVSKQNSSENILLQRYSVAQASKYWNVKIAEYRVIKISKTSKISKM